MATDRRLALVLHVLCPSFLHTLPSLTRTVPSLARTVPSLARTVPSLAVAEAYCAVTGCTLTTTPRS